MAERGKRAELRAEITELQRQLTIARLDLQREEQERVAAQRGLVANYHSAAQMVHELREAGLEEWAVRMWTIGLHRNVAHDPDLTPVGLTIVGTQRSAPNDHNGV